MIFCPAAKEKKKRKNSTKRVVFAFENFYSLSLCAYSLNRSPYPRGTHTHAHQTLGASVLFLLLLLGA